MGGCVLRAWGDDFQADSFLSGSSLEPCNVFIKGARKSEGRSWNTSGLTVLVSDHSDNFKHQVTDAIEFLTSNRLELQRLKSSVGLDGLSLDFGVSQTDSFCQNHFFPPELISLAAECRLALEVSILRHNIAPISVAAMLNKSLDRSGGGVFRIKPGGAKVE